MDDFANHTPSLTSPAQEAEAVTPSDSVALARASRAIYVGTGGNLRLQLVSGGEVTLSNVQAGVCYPLRVAQVFATGTTAGNLVALR